MKKLIYLLTIISSVFFFSSCQKANDNNDEGGVDNVFVGEWERNKREIHDTVNGQVDFDTDKMNYTFSKDGSYILSDGFSSPERGNWTYDEAAKTLVIGKKTYEVLEVSSTDAQIKIENKAYNNYFIDFLKKK